MQPKSAFYRHHSTVYCMQYTRMTAKLTGKVALVTGASKGIGRGLAMGLAEAGARVVINYKNDAQGAETVCADIRDKGGEARSMQADIGVKLAFENMVNQVSESFGRLDVLVNNAARTR